MKRSKVYIAVLGFGACVAVLLGGIFLLTHEQVTETEPVGPSGRALRDPFWAASLLLTEMGVPTESRYGLGELPAPDAGAVVVVLADNHEQRMSMAERLSGWVEAGGHVIFAAQPSDPVPFGALWEDPALQVSYRADPLQSAFGITSKYDDFPHWMTPTLMRLEAHPGLPPEAARALVTETRVHVEGSDCPMVVGEGHAEDAAGIPPLRASIRTSCPILLGRATAVSSVDLFHNTALMDERGDNAAFLWDTVALEAVPTQAILVLRGDAPSFFALLWNRGWPVLIGIACTFLAWAGWQSQRFGAILDQPVEARRSMLEHLDASGAILWRHKRVQGLSNAMRKAVRAQLARRSPGIAQLSGDDLAHAIADLTGHPVETIHRVLLAPPPTERRAFIDMVQILQQLWRDASPVPSGSSS